MGPSDHVPQASGPRKKRESVRDCKSARSTGAVSKCRMQTKPLNPHILLRKAGRLTCERGTLSPPIQLAVFPADAALEAGQQQRSQNWLELQGSLSPRRAATPFSEPRPSFCERGRVSAKARYHSHLDFWRGATCPTRLLVSSRARFLYVRSRSKLHRRSFYFGFPSWAGLKSEGDRPTSPILLFRASNIAFRALRNSLRSSIELACCAVNSLRVAEF